MMKHYSGVLAAVSLTALVFVSAPACADLQYKDSGDEVYYLQELLRERGYYLEAEPDGEYGGLTEEAVRTFQADMGLEQTGIATDQVMSLLESGGIPASVDVPASVENQDTAAADAQQASGETADTAAAGQVSGDVCMLLSEGSSLRRIFCAEHSSILAREREAVTAGDADALAQVNQSWEDAANAIYNDWVSTASAEDSRQILAACSAWKEYLEAQRSALETFYSGEPLKAQQQLASILKSQVTILCNEKLIRGQTTGASASATEPETGTGTAAETVLAGAPVITIDTETEAPSETTAGTAVSEAAAETAAGETEASETTTETTAETTVSEAAAETAAGETTTSETTASEATAGTAVGETEASETTAETAA